LGQKKITKYGLSLIVGAVNRGSTVFILAWHDVKYYHFFLFLKLKEKFGI
jgi:hypothetical protein